MSGSARDFRVVALIIASTLFMENLDATILTTAIPAMARDFAVSAPGMSVSLTAYLVALALLIPASGHVADRWGAQRVLRAAIAIFAGGSLLCALAPNLTLLAMARFAQGVGGAMMVPVGRLVLLRTVAKRDLVAANSWLVMPGLFGQICGPALGGLIVTYLQWRWIFWINLPIGILGLFLVGRFVPNLHEEVLRPFDLRGFLLAGVALVSLLFGLDAGGRGAAFPLVGGMLVIGLASGALYLLHAAGRRQPVLEVSLLRVPTFRWSLIGGSLTRVTHGAQPFLLPLMMQLAYGMKAYESGLITLGTSLGTVAMKGFVGRILRRWGFKASLTLMGILGAGSYALCGLFRPGWPIGAIFAVLVLSGFLLSFQFTAYNTIAYDEIAPARMSAATSFYSTFQQLTLSLGICIGAVALHVSMAAAGRLTPAFADFTAAFFTVTGISLCAVMVNVQFDRDAGREMTGAA